MIFPSKINEFIKDKNYSQDDVGMSNSQVLIFDEMVLKIEKRTEWKEMYDFYKTQNIVNMMNWSQDFMIVPKVLCFEQTEEFVFLSVLIIVPSFFKPTVSQYPEDMATTFSHSFTKLILWASESYPVETTVPSYFNPIEWSLFADIEIIFFPSAQSCNVFKFGLAIRFMIFIK